MRILYNFFIRSIFYIYLFIPYFNIERRLLSLSSYRSKVISDNRFSATRFEVSGEPPRDVFITDFLNEYEGKERRVTIYDFGGGVGKGYLRFRKYFPSSYQLNYTVFETKNMVDSSASADTSFICSGDSINWCCFDVRFKPVTRSSDLVILFSDSCFQYLENAVDLLEQLMADIDPDIVVIDRVPLAVSTKRSCVQLSLLSAHVDCGILELGFFDKFMITPIFFHECDEFLVPFSSRSMLLLESTAQKSRTFRRFGGDLFLARYVFKRSGF
ncbi:hypothetical protein XMG59_001587 [Marinobacterium sp. xm-g-59]|uniref:hypothetical protein n=1 Tax=Marinobacterium sp. xm-g-59 TaxID=2497748 RepID=UPI00156836AD|nr:hypothetical protein [Marinobacterium sp. xm-g-59]NRP95483.1 hypothetical protein [Marinobacterium sp. xm-g-59]